MTLNNEQVVDMLESYDKESKALKKSLLKLCPGVVSVKIAIEPLLLITLHRPPLCVITELHSIFNILFLESIVNPLRI